MFACRIGVPIRARPTRRPFQQQLMALRHPKGPQQLLTTSVLELSTATGPVRCKPLVHEGLGNTAVRVLKCTLAACSLSTPPSDLPALWSSHYLHLKVSTCSPMQAHWPATTPPTSSRSIAPLLQVPIQPSNSPLPSHFMTPPSLPGPPSPHRAAAQAQSTRGMTFSIGMPPYWALQTPLSMAAYSP